jgi:hypothetical protein
MSNQIFISSQFYKLYLFSCGGGLLFFTHSGQKNINLTGIDDNICNTSNSNESPTDFARQDKHLSVLTN